MTLLGAGKPPVSAPPAYTGPGDVASGATHHWGVYAYDAAYATGSNPCLDLVDQAGGNALTVNIATNGLIDTVAIASWLSANPSIITIRIAKAYDQIGSMHLDNTALSAYPALTLNAIGSIPAITNPAESRWLRYDPGIGTVAQPYSMTGVAKRTSALAAFNAAFGVGTTPIAMLFWQDTPGQVILSAGGLIDSGVAGAENTLQSMSMLANGAASKGAIDGAVGSAVNAGTDAATGYPFIFSPSLDMGGQVLGWTFWPSDISSSFAALHANDQTVLGI